MTRTIDVMTENPATISSNATVEAAVRMLEDLEIRHLPVVDSGELIGMVSDRDLRGAMGAGIEGAMPLKARIVDIMSSNLVQALADDDIGVVAELMIDNRIGAVPIVDERGALVGIVSYVDVLKSLVGKRS